MANSSDDPRVDLVSPDLAPKVIHAGDDWVGQPYVLVDSSSVRMNGGLQNGISISDEFGTILQGPISLSESPENISFGGGYWRINPMVTACIGSSAATPVPWLVNDTPEVLKAKDDLSGILDSLG
jgi:hypothetical protein